MFIQREVGDKTDRALVTGIETDHTAEIHKGKVLDATTGDNHHTDMFNVEMIVEEEVIDIKIIIEMTVEIEGDKILGEVLVVIEVGQEKEA